MKQLIPAAIVGVFIVAGGAGGFYLKGSGGSAEASSAVASEPSGEKGQDKKKDSAGKSEAGQETKKKSSAGGNGAGTETDPSDVTYYKFSREFVVPLIEDERVESLVIININLEVDNSTSQKLFTMEPKLRDNIMTTLIKLSHDGDTLRSFTNVENYETIRSVVLGNLRQIAPDGIENVLILDMAKQDL